MKRKAANFGPKVKVGKMKIKVFNVRFFNSSFIKRTLIFELHEGSIQTWKMLFSLHHPNFRLNKFTPKSA